MKLTLDIAQDHPSLAKAEFSTQLKPLGSIIEDENYSIITTKTQERVKNLSLTKQACVYFFSIPRSPEGILLFQKRMKKYEKGVLQPIRVVVQGAESEERKVLITAVIDSLHHPAVDLDHPSTTIVFSCTKRNIHVGTLYHETRQDNSRAMHHLPAPHPSGMQPRMTRALINLTGARKTLLDPFCGAGGFLIEAAHQGLLVEGWDIDPSMMKRARLNTEGSTNITLKRENALNLKKSKHPEYILADLPYGRNTKAVDHKKLYSSFLRILKEVSFKKAVLIFPSTAFPERLARKTGLNVIGVHTVKVHNTLSRIILEIEGRK